MKGAVWSAWGKKSAVWSVWSVKCGLWSVTFRVRRVQCEVWTVKCAVWSVKCGVRRVQCEVWRVWSVKSAVWRVQCEVCSVECEDCQVGSVPWSFKCEMWNRTPVSQSARTHGLGWRTARASSIDEKGLIYISKATSAPPRAGTTGIIFARYSKAPEDGHRDLQVCKTPGTAWCFTIALTALRRRKHAGANMLILVELASSVEESTFDANICCTWIVDVSSWTTILFNKTHIIQKALQIMARSWWTWRSINCWLV